MNDAPRRTLRELVGRHGPGLSGDARRREVLLREEQRQRSLEPTPVQTP